MKKRFTDEQIIGFLKQAHTHTRGQVLLFAICCVTSVMLVILSDDITVTVKFTVSYRRIVTAELELAWTTKNPQAFTHAGFLDFLGRC